MKTILFGQLEEMASFVENEKSKLSELNNSTILNIYSIEQMLNIIKDDFKPEYDEYMKEVERLRNRYNELLEESKNKLTFIVDPNIDSILLGDVLRLEESVKEFIDIKYKVETFIKSLETFIVRLNILYNITIKYDSNEDKQKHFEKLQKIYELQEEMHNELAEYEALLKKEKKYLKACEYVSYIEYTILKLEFRIDDDMVDLDEISDESVNIYKDYILDEISDLKELVESTTTLAIKQAYSYNLSRIINTIVNTDNISKLIKNNEIWISFLENETNTLEVLRLEKIDENLIKVKVLDRLEVRAKEEDFLISPATLSRIELCAIYAKHKDDKLLFTIKFLECLNDKVTYKELYFIFVLFDIYQYIKNEDKKLARILAKYEKKYSYPKKDLDLKKELVKETTQKEYYELFNLNENTKLLNTLDKLNIDYKVDEDKIYINSFYFKSLENIEESFK